MASNCRESRCTPSRNKSQPPRTIADDKGTFEIALPEGAELESAQAKGPGGQPIAVEATPAAQKNHYAFNYPLRPGETQFQIAYHAPYSGEASISPKPLQAVQHFVVMMPKSMAFTPKDAQQFQSMSDPQSVIMVATDVKPGQDLSFRVAGTGIFPTETSRAAKARLIPAEAQWAVAKQRRMTIVPGADWALLSTRPTRCMNIACTSWEHSR